MTTGLVAPPVQAGSDLLSLGLVVVVLGLLAAILGARGVAGLSMTLTKWLVIVFVVLALIAIAL